MTQFREIATGLRFPEGPIAMPDGSIVLVEIEGQTLKRVEPDGQQTIVARLGGGPNGAAIGPDGKCYVCNNGRFKWLREEGRMRPVLQADDYSGGRIERVDLQTGAVEVLYRGVGATQSRARTTSFSTVPAASGSPIWARCARATSDRGAVYYAKADGSLIREVIQPMTQPNGIGLLAQAGSAVRRRELDRSAVGVRNQCARRNQATAVAVAQWRKAGRRFAQLSVV